MIEKYLNKDCIWLNQEQKNKEDLFTVCAKRLETLDLVEPEYLKALLEREKQFPTGLQMENYAVAIPHADPSVIKKDFIAVVTLKETIKMYCMEDTSKEADVKTFFLLGLKNGESHLKILREFITMIQNEDIINALHKVEDENEVINIIEAYSESN